MSPAAQIAARKNCLGPLLKKLVRQNLNLLSSLAGLFMPRNRLTQISARSEYAIYMFEILFVSWKVDSELREFCYNAHCFVILNSLISRSTFILAICNELRKPSKARSQLCNFELFCCFVSWTWINVDVHAACADSNFTRFKDTITGLFC